MTVDLRPTLQRPLGVTILAILGLIDGVLSVLRGVAVLTVGGPAGAATGLGGIVPMFGLFAIVVGLINVSFAYGAWTLKPWAWILGVVAAVLGIVWAIMDFVIDSSQLVSTIFSIVINGVIIYYLNTPAVKAAFRRA